MKKITLILTLWLAVSTAAFAGAGAPQEFSRFALTGDANGQATNSWTNLLNVLALGTTTSSNFNAQSYTLNGITITSWLRDTTAALNALFPTNYTVFVIPGDSQSASVEGQISYENFIQNYGYSKIIVTAVAGTDINYQRTNYNAAIGSNIHANNGTNYIVCDWVGVNNYPHGFYATNSYGMLLSIANQVQATGTNCFFVAMDIPPCLSYDGTWISTPWRDDVRLYNQLVYEGHTNFNYYLPLSSLLPSDWSSTVDGLHFVTSVHSNNVVRNLVNALIRAPFTLTAREVDRFTDKNFYAANFAGGTMNGAMTNFPQPFQMQIGTNMDILMFNYLTYAILAWYNDAQSQVTPGDIESLGLTLGAVNGNSLTINAVGGGVLLDLTNNTPSTSTLQEFQNGQYHAFAGLDNALSPSLYFDMEGTNGMWLGLDGIHIFNLVYGGNIGVGTMTPATGFDVTNRTVNAQAYTNIGTGLGFGPYQFNGNGGGLTNIALQAITNDGIAFLASNNVFTGSNNFQNGLTLASGGGAVNIGTNAAGVIQPADNGGETAALTVNGPAKFINTNGEFQFVNSTAYTGGAPYWKDGVISLMATGGGSGFSASAARFLNTNAGEQGAVGYQGASTGWYATNVIFLSASTPYPANGGALTVGPPPNVGFSQEGYHGGTLMQSFRQFWDTNGDLHFSDMATATVNPQPSVWISNNVPQKIVLVGNGLVYGDIIATNSAQEGGWRVWNNTGTLTSFGSAGSGLANYGMFLGGQAFLYSTTNINIGVDQLGGLITLGTGGGGGSADVVIGAGGTTFSSSVLATNGAVLYVNTNNGGGMAISNASAGSDASAALQLYNNLGNTGSLFLTGSGYATYENVGTNTIGLYHGAVAGDIAFLNDSGGKITLRTGGHTYNDFAISPSGVAVANTLSASNGFASYASSYTPTFSTGAWTNTNAFNVTIDYYRGVTNFCLTNGAGTFIFGPSTASSPYSRHLGPGWVVTNSPTFVVISAE